MKKLGIDRFLFLAGLLVALALKLWVQEAPHLARLHPPEVDDTYAYLMKSAQMQGCFLQDCAALRDLRQQLAGTYATPEEAYRAWDVESRTFMVYHPLYSIVVLALRALGVGWEAASEAIGMAGMILVVGGAAWWLRSFVAPGPAGIALVMIAFTAYTGHGLNLIVPGNIALGLAMWTWGSAVRGGRWTAPFLVVSAIALCTLHHVGKLYAAVAVLFYALFHPRPFAGRDWAAIGGSAAAVAAFLVAMATVSRPQLGIPPLPKELAKDLAGILAWNMSPAIREIEGFVSLFFGPLPFLAMAAAGLYVMPRTSRYRCLATTGTMAVLLAGSLLDYHPGHPINLLQRLLIPFSIPAFATIAAAIHAWGGLFWRGLVRLLDRARVRPAGAPVGLGLAAVAVVGGLFFARWLPAFFFNGWLAHRNVVWGRTIAHDVDYDSEQVRLLMSPDVACRRVYYAGDRPFFFYMTHGAQDCGAVLATLVAGKASMARWVDGTVPISHVVGPAPAGASRGKVVIAGRGGVALEIEKGSPARSWSFKIGNPGGARDLEIEADGRQVRVPVGAGWHGWLAPGSALHEGARRIVFSLADGGPPMTLEGMRPAAGIESANWPWDMGVSIMYERAHGPARTVTYRFSSAQLFEPGGRRVEVLRDRGSLVLGRLLP
jgi:hypothetical protein